tara:strand:+ start:2826 stop:13295 length:10470 start_codon:yes stop_codon:yes gene_type:complete
MSIYANRMTQDRVNILGDYITDPITPPRFELGEKRIMPDGKGGFMYGDDVDFLSLKTQYPDQFNTGALSELYHAITPDMDSSSAGISGANISMDNNNSARLARRNVTQKFFTSYFGESLASSLANNAFSKDNAIREVIDLGGSIGIRPSVSLYQDGRAGEDRSTIAIAGNNERNWAGLLNAKAYELYKQKFLARGGDESMVDSSYRRSRNRGSNSYQESYIEAAYQLDRLSEPEFNAATAGTEEERKELVSRLYQSGINDVLLADDDLDRFDSTLWQMLDYQARDERGLSGLSAKQFVYEQAQRQTIRKLHFLLNGDNEKAGDPALLAIQIQNLSETVGPDFLEEALSRVVVTDDSWKETIYDTLEDTEKELLMKAGITHEMLADNTTNPFSYMMTANMSAQKQAAMDLREMMFEKDYHDGWFNWTRRLSDTIKADIANDPYAMYFLTGAVPVGVFAGTALSAGTAAGATNVGKIMAYTAIDGFVAGAAEGYAASIGGQTSLIMEGARTELDFTGVYTNMALYGGMGAIGGAGIAGGINRIGPAFRGTSRVATRMTDYVADTGALGEAAKVRGLNRLAEREATVPEIEGAQIFSNIENQGLAIRLNRGEVEAKDVLAETIPLLVIRKEGEDLSETIEDLFSSETLAKYGLSSADAVDLVFGIQKKLGAGAQIGTEEFDTIIQAVFREAKDLASDGAETAQQRLDMLDRTLKSKGIDTAKRFVGGSGRQALSDKEAVTLKALLNKLKDSGIPGQPAATRAEINQLLKLIPRINDEKSLRGAQKILNNSKRLSEADTLAFNKRLDDIVSRGTEARKDSFLQDLLKVENAFSLLRNERAIRVALDLGVSAKQIMKYTREYKGLVGNAEEIAKLNARYPDIKKAIKQIAEGKGLEAYDAVKSSFNVSKFLNEAGVVQNVRNFTKFRSNLRRKFNKISGAKLDESSFTKKISQEITRRKGIYRDLAKKLGINIDVDEAFERLSAQVLNDIPFKARNSALKANALRDAVDKIILSQSPDALKVGERSTDRWWLGTIFKGTSIGDFIERNISAAVNWPIKQARLFRSRNRIVRGFSNFITGQHINNRVYSNSTDFMSIEAIVEGASREALPYVNYINGLKVRLGGPSFKEFDFLFLKLRQLGKLIGDIDEDVLPEEMIRVFGGDVNALKTELKNVQKLYTNFMQKALDEMAEAGAPIANTNAARYIPNMIRGGLSADRAKQFVDGFVQIRTNQLLSGNNTLDKDVLNSLGFIKIVKNDVVEAGGKPVLNKPFIVPEDSPFWIGNLEDSIKYAESVIKEGYEGLKRLDTGEAGTGSAVARSLGVIERIRRDPGNITKLQDNYFEMRGNHFGLPLGRNPVDAATATGVAHAVADTDSFMNQMRRAYNQLNGMSAEERALYDLENPEFTIKDMLIDLDNAMAVRGYAIVSEVREQMISGEVKLRRKPMSQNQKLKYVSSRESYAGLSKGHESLLNKLDNLIAEGFLDEDAARVVMLAFVDVDPHKMMGMTFTYLDSVVDGGTLGIARSTKDFNGRPVEGGTIGLSLLRELEKTEYGDALNVASILVHETAHLSFLSAPAKMQATIQALFVQTKNGENEIRRLFERAGIGNVEYALSNVHEFAAALAEISLVRNQLAMKNGPLKEFLHKFSQFFKKLIGDISILKKESDSIGYEILGEEKFKAIKAGVKSWYDLSADDAPADRLQRTFGITEAEKIDEYGDAAYLVDKKSLITKKEQLNLALELARRGGLNESEYDSFVKLQNLSPDDMDESQISKLMELSEKRNKVQVAGKEVDLQDQLTKLEQEIDSINETLQRLETKVDPGVRDAPISKAVEEKPAAKVAEADPTEAAAPKKISFNFKRKKDEYGDPYQVTTVNGRPLEIERNTSGVGDENGWFIRNFETITGPEARAANIDSSTERMITAQRGGGLVATNRAEMEKHIQDLIDNNRIYYDVDRRAWRPTEARDVSNASTSTSSSATTTKKVTVVKPKEEPEVTLKIRTTDKDGKVQPSRVVSGKRSDIEDSVKAKGETIVTEEDKTLTPADPKKGKFKGMFSKSGKQAEPTEEQASDPVFLKETLDAVTERFINGRKLNGTLSKQLEAFTEVLFAKLFKDEAWPTINGRRMSQDEIFLAANNGVKNQTLTIAKRGPSGDEQGLRVKSRITKEEKARKDILSEKKKSGKALTNAEEKELNQITGRSKLVERGESAEISLSSAKSDEVVLRNLSEADEELSVLIDSGLHSTSPEAQKAAVKLINARKFMDALRSREGTLEPGGRGGYKLTDNQVTSIAEETGLTEPQVRTHNHSEGVFDLKNIRKLTNVVVDEVSEKDKIFGRNELAKLKAQREEAELDEIVTTHPAVADDIAETSAGNTKATLKSTVNKYDNAADTKFLGVPGYTRMTQEEFDEIVDSYDDLMMFMKNIRDWDMPNPGEGVSFAREAKDYFVARQQEQELTKSMDSGDIPEQAADEAPAKTRRTGPQRLADGDDQDFRRPSDKELRARYEEEAQARLRAEEIAETRRTGPQRLADGDNQDFRRPSDKDLRARYEEEAQARLERDDISNEALFKSMEGPAPRKPAELSDDELIEIGSSLEAKLSKEGSLSSKERTLYNEINSEITFRSRKPLDAGDGAPPSKPPKSPAGAGDDPDPKKPSDIIDALDEYFARKNEAQVEAGSFNKAHRLAGKGTLAELYASAVKGDNMDIFSEQWMKGLEQVGRKVMAPLRVAAYDYLDHAGGNFKHSHMANPSDLNIKIKTLDDIRMPHRTFNISDFDNPDGSIREGGEELASLFAEAGNSMEHIIRYADTHLASTRIQKAINDLFGFKGATMSDMFDEIENSLTLNLKTDTTGKKRTITERDYDREVSQYMESLRELYLRARGFNPQRTREFSQASRITQNIAYSILGAKFAMSVLFVEVPMTILRTSGLNPFKLIRNTGIITGSLLDAARGEAVKYKPVQKFMSSLGLDKRIMKETIEDLAYSTQNLRSSSMAKFGAGGDAMEDGELMTSVAERLKTHVNNVRSGLAQEGHSDPSWLKRLADGVEAFTGATADLTGLASGMLPVTNAVRTVAANQAKATLLKHSDKLIVLSKEISGRELTLKQIQGIARELGIPQTLVTYAAESGLLRPGIMEELMSASGLNTRSAGRELDLNELGESLAGRSSDANSGVVSLEFSDIARNRMKVQDSILPSLNQYIMFVTQEMSPELRGTMRFQGMNPLVDMLFQMLSYPMAAYQALVGNGVRARGPMMTAGILTSLTAFEYINRNAQAVLFKEDEDRRKQAMENLTTMPDMNKVIEVLATYGFSSPLFGSVGPYMRDIVGNTVLRAMQSSERNFPVRPFSSPAVAMVQKTYGRLSRFAGNIGSYVGGGPGAEKRLGSAFSDVAETVGEILPFNALPFQLSKAPFREGMKATSVAMTAGSGRNIPYLSHPTLEDLGYIKWMGSAQQPHGWSEVDYPDDRLIPNPPPVEEEPVEKKQESKAPPLLQRPEPSAPRSPSEGLADRLN